jgi:hypothetical protein
MGLLYEMIGRVDNFKKKKKRGTTQPHHTRPEKGTENI